MGQGRARDERHRAYTWWVSLCVAVEARSAEYGFLSCAGYTVLDNVIAVNGTLFVVANDWTKLPKLGDIASSSLDATKPPRVQDWHILTTQDAAEMFGPYAAK